MKQKIAAAVIGVTAFFAYLFVTVGKTWVGGTHTVPGLQSVAPPSVDNHQVENIKVFTDIVYNTEHKRQVLDVYSPNKLTNAPVLFFVHGGGWTEGDKSMYGHIGRHFSNNGFCTVIINHRQSPEVKHPDHVMDAAKAFAWTREHIAAYGGNPDRISLMGHSSGGHLTALLASDPTYLKQFGHSPKEVHSLVGISGVYSINLMVTLSGYGHVFHRKDHESASPINYTPACPVLLLHGEKDYVSMPRQCTSFRDKIVRSGGSCEVFVADGETHESIIVNAGKSEKAYVKKVMDFLAK